MSQEAAVLEPGDRVGDWIVASALGESRGAGTVYLCHSAMTDGGEAAVKIIVPHGLDEAERMARDLEAQATLDHPSIPRVLGWGRSANHGGWWVAVDLMPGEDLRSRLRHGPVDAAGLVAAMADMAEALAEAHASGITHRDIHPSNLVLAPQGGIVVDFGAGVPSGRGALTEHGMVQGTIEYAAPELFGREVVDDRALDVYALGQVLHECLAQQAAYDDAEDVVAAKLAAGRLDPGDAFPDALRWVVREATSPDPARRPNMRYFAARLRVLADHGLDAEQVRKVGPDVAAPSPDRRVVLIAAAVGAVAVIAVGIAVVWQVLWPGGG